MNINYIKEINNSKVYDVAEKTPITLLSKVSAKYNNTVYLKREDLQPIFSFKCRGAYNKISSLNPKQIAKGIIAASAGNHAQGVALSASKLNINALIVMPTTTPSIKIDSVIRSYNNLPIFSLSLSDRSFPEFVVKEIVLILSILKISTPHC